MPTYFNSVNRNFKTMDSSAAVNQVRVHEQF